MFTVRIPIDTDKSAEAHFNKCFFYAWKSSNLMVCCAQQRMNALNSDRAYRNAREEYGRRFSGKKTEDLSKAQKRRKKELSALMQEKQKSYGLSKTDFEKYLSVQQHRYNAWLTSHQMQAIADQVWKGAESVLYGKGRSLHFKRLTDMDTIPQKDNNGIRLNGWNDLVFMKRHYALKAPDSAYLQSVRDKGARVRYCYLKRIEFSSGWKYYAVIVLEGDPPHKEKTRQGHRVGIDIGTSTVAAESEEKVMLENLAPDSIRYEKEVRHLQALLDHKMRMANPDNYADDGTVRKGKKKWHISRQANRLKKRIRVLHRKEAAYILCSHRRQINRILSSANEVIVEPVSLKAMQKRSKKTERSDRGAAINGKIIHKYKRKKRYGHSIKNHAPGRFLLELKRKAEVMDIPYYEIRTSAYKASQFHHDTGEYIPSPVNERYKIISGITVQRDLYSAFLIRHTLDTLNAPDIDACMNDFEKFADISNRELAAMKAAGISNQACWGF